MHPFAGPSPTPGPGFFISGSLSFWAAGSCHCGAGSGANKPNPGPSRPVESILLTSQNPSASSGSRCNPVALGPMMSSLRTRILSRAILFAQNTSEVLPPKEKRGNFCETSRARPFQCSTTQTIPPTPSCLKPRSKLFFATARLCPIPPMPTGSTLCRAG